MNLINLKNQIQIQFFAKEKSESSERKKWIVGRYKKMWIVRKKKMNHPQKKVNLPSRKIHKKVNLPTRKIHRDNNKSPRKFLPYIQKPVFYLFVKIGRPPPDLFLRINKVQNLISQNRQFWGFLNFSKSAILRFSENLKIAQKKFFPKMKIKWK